MSAAPEAQKYQQIQARRRWLLIPLALVVTSVVVLSLGVGDYPISWLLVCKALAARLAHRGLADPSIVPVVCDIRAPRAIVGLLVGAGLAGSGVVFQALFRNPMADPYVIGVSSGAALGAVLEITLAGMAVGHWLGPSTSLGARAGFAFLGGILAVVLVYRTALRGSRVQAGTLLLAGVAVSSFLSAITAYLLLRLSAGGSAADPLAWLLGGLQDKAWTDALVAGPGVLVSLLAIGMASRTMNLLLLGDESAQQLGVDPERARRWLVAAATIATASAVSVSGIIGFVGLILPHLARLIWGPDHRTLVPASALLGGGFLVLADTAARVVLPGQELPVGIITALAGAPFFLGLLRARKPAL